MVTSNGGSSWNALQTREQRTVAIARKGDYPAMEVWLGTRRVADRRIEGREENRTGGPKCVECGQGVPR